VVNRRIDDVLLNDNSKCLTEQQPMLRLCFNTNSRNINSTSAVSSPMPRNCIVKRSQVKAMKLHL